MSRGGICTLHGLMAILTATGAAFAWMKYAMTTEDPFAAVNHPWQPAMLAGHVVVAPLAVFGLGWLFAGHVWPKYRSPALARRRTGVLMMTITAPMVLSGYLLQAATGEGFRLSMAATHWIASGVFVLGYAAHLLSRRRPAAMDSQD